MSSSRLKLFVLGCALLAIFSCSRNIRKDGAPDPELALSPRVTTGELANGLSYYVLNNREPVERCYLRLNVLIGSFVEDENELGMAHFLEHLAFDDRSISGDVSLTDWFQNHGMAIGPDANAETYPDHTTYKIDLPRCDQETVQTALRILRSFADGLAFRDEAIAKEKNIIDAEDREYHDAQTQLAKKLLGNLYSNTFYVSRPVLGTIDARSAFTKEMIHAFYSKWYTPDNMSVIFVGDFGELNAEQLIATAFNTMEDRKAPSKPTSGNPDHETPYFALHEDDLAHVETVFSIQAKDLHKPFVRKKDLKDKLAFELALAMLQENLSQAFQKDTQQIREPTIDGSFISNGVYELNLSVASFNEDVEKKFLDAYAVVNNASQNGFDENAFNSAKAVLRDTLEQAVVAETTLNSDAWANRIIDHLNDNAIAADAAHILMTIEPILAGISAKDSQAALKKALKSGNHYLYALGAIDEGDHTQKRLANLLAQAKNQKPEEKVAQIEIPFLYHANACTVPELTREPIPGLAASAVRLNNGIEIILKPTKFKTDDVRIEIITSEGDGGMSRKDIALASLAKLVVFDGGLGKHDPAAVMQIIKDKYFNLSFSVLTDRMQASIVTRNRDVQFVLELAKAFITDAAYNDAVVKRIKDQIAIVYREREHQLWSPIETDFLRMLTNNDYRVGLLPFEELASITHDDLLAWHKRYITDQQWRIVVVGDFNEDVMIKTIFCIFNDLPTHKSKTVSIPQLSFKSGINQSYRVKSKDQAALINVRYPLNFTSTPYPDHRLQILQSVINEVVRQKLREKKQTTYSPTVTIAENKVPTIQNWVDVSFFAEKDKAEQAVKDIKLIIDKLAQKGVNKEKLTKAKEPYLAQAKQALLDNGYWVSVVANNFSEARTLSWFARIEADVAAITIRDINQLLRKYFRVKNASSAISYPVEQ